MSGHALKRQWLHLNVSMAAQAEMVKTQKRRKRALSLKSQYWGINGSNTSMTRGKENLSKRFWGLRFGLLYLVAI